MSGRASYSVQRWLECEEFKPAWGNELRRSSTGQGSPKGRLPVADHIESATVISNPSQAPQRERLLVWPRAAQSSADDRPRSSTCGSSSVVPGPRGVAQPARTRCPGDPSATISRPSFRPRLWRLRRMRLQDSLLSRCPLSQANTTLRPSDKAPMITSNAARSFASPLSRTSRLPTGTRPRGRTGPAGPTRHTPTARSISVVGSMLATTERQRQAVRAWPLAPANNRAPV